MLTWRNIQLGCENNIVTQEKCSVESTHRNEHAVKVSVLLLICVGMHCTQQLLEPLNPRDSQDGDANVAAEGL